MAFTDIFNNFTKLIYTPEQMDQQVLKAIKAPRPEGLETIKRMIKAGAPLQARGENGNNMLFVAAEYKRAEAFSALLETGLIDLGEKDRNGRTLLHTVIAWNNPELLKQLIAKGANIEKRDAYKRTPLYLAVETYAHDCIAILMVNDADINRRNGDGLTPLMQAAANEDAYVVRKLLEAGADMDAKSQSNATVHQFAETNDFDEVYDVLKEFTQKREDEVTAKVQAEEQEQQKIKDSCAQGLPTAKPLASRKFFKKK